MDFKLSKLIRENWWDFGVLIILCLQDVETEKKMAGRKERKQVHEVQKLPFVLRYISVQLQSGWACVHIYAPP